MRSASAFLRLPTFLGSRSIAQISIQPFAPSIASISPEAVIRARPSFIQASVISAILRVMCANIHELTVASSRSAAPFPILSSMRKRRPAKLSTMSRIFASKTALELLELRQFRYFSRRLRRSTMSPSTSLRTSSTSGSASDSAGAANTRLALPFELFSPSLLRK